MLGESFNSSFSMGDIPLETLEEGIIVRANMGKNEQQEGEEEGERQVVAEHSDEDLQCKSTSSMNHSHAHDDSGTPTSMPLTARPHDARALHHDGDDEGGKNAASLPMHAQTGQKIAFAVESRRGSSVLPFLAFNEQNQERLRRQQLEQDHLKPDSMTQNDGMGELPRAPGEISAPQSFQNALLPPHVPSQSYRFATQSQTQTGILAEANSFSPSPLALRAVSPSTRETEEINRNEAYVERENREREKQFGLGVRAPITDAFSKPQVTSGSPQTAFAGQQQAPSTFSHPSSRIIKQAGVGHHGITGPSSMTEGRHQDHHPPHQQQQQQPLLPFTRVTREIRKVTAKPVVAAVPAKGAASTVFEVWPDDNNNRASSKEPLSFGTVGEDQPSSPSFEGTERSHFLNSNYSSNSMNNNNNTGNSSNSNNNNKAPYTPAREGNDERVVSHNAHATPFNHTHPSERRSEISVLSQLGRKLPVVAEPFFLLSLYHPHLITLSGMEGAVKSEEKDMTMIIAEHTTGFVGGGGSSSSSVALSLPQPPEVVARYTFAVVSALCFLHHRGVVHRNVKAANIMLCDEVVKLALADNRISGKGEGEEALLSTSLNWMPPEVIIQNKQQQQQQQHDDGGDEQRTHSAFSSANFSAVDVSVEDHVASAARSGWCSSDRRDIWSLGCAVIEMITGLKPFEEEARRSGQSLEHFIENLVDPVPLPESISSVDALHFTRCCLRVNPSDRLSAEALLHHRFIEKYFTQTETTRAHYCPSDLMGSERERRDSYASVFTALTHKGSEYDAVLRRHDSSRMSSRASQHATPPLYDGLNDRGRYSKPTLAFPPIPILVESRRESENPMLPSTHEITTSGGEVAIVRPPSVALSLYSNCFFHFEKKRTVVVGPRGLEEVSSTVGDTPLPFGSSCSRMGNSPQPIDGNSNSNNDTINNVNNVTNRNSSPPLLREGGGGVRGRGRGLLPFVTATSHAPPQRNGGADPLTDLVETAGSIPCRREASGNSPSEVHVPPNPLVAPSRLGGEQRGEWSGVPTTQQHHVIDVFANEEHTEAAIVTMHEPQSSSGSDTVQRMVVRNKKHAVLRLASCVKREWVSVVVGALIVSLVAATIALLVISL